MAVLTHPIIRFIARRLLYSLVVLLGVLTHPREPPVRGARSMLREEGPVPLLGQSLVVFTRLRTCEEVLIEPSAR